MSMVEISVMVPAERVAEFYSLHGRWLQQLADGTTESAERLAWRTSDADLAEQVWPQLPASSKLMLEVLIERGSVEGHALVTELGMNDPSQIIGVNGWIGRISARVNRTSPIEARSGASGTVWSIDREIASMFAGSKPAASPG